jgi:hypothetical protein
MVNSVPNRRRVSRRRSQSTSSLEHTQPEGFTTSGQSSRLCDELEVVRGKDLRQDAAIHEGEIVAEVLDALEAAGRHVRTHGARELQHDRQVTIEPQQTHGVLDASLRSGVFEDQRSMNEVDRLDPTQIVGRKIDAVKFEREMSVPACGLRQVSRIDIDSDHPFDDGAINGIQAIASSDTENSDRA